MRIRGISAPARFFISLLVLLTALAATAALGLHGLDQVDRANQQVFHDNFLTAEATNRLSVAMSRAEVLSLQIVESRTLRTAETLRGELHNVVLPEVDARIAEVLRRHAGDPPAEYAQIKRIPEAWQAYVPLTRQRPLAPGSAPLGSAGVSAAARRIVATLDPTIAFVASRQDVEQAAAAKARTDAKETYDTSRTWLIVAIVFALLATASLVRSGIMLKRLMEVQATQTLRSQTTNEYTGTLQATQSEDDAHELVRRQVERTQPGARAVVLARNNSADRLEPRTSLDGLDALRAPLEHATPGSCLAVRYARRHVQTDNPDALTRCELCGALAGPLACEPLLVSGEVIGSVLVILSEEPDDKAGERIRETVSQAAPILANLRNLAIAELRAATDLLTGLPNHRAVQDTLKRMVAQASRTITPLSAVLVDLDHFKQINDVYGHDQGDEILAAVGDALKNAIRESDFAGRYGGEEFLLLLPATDTAGALHVAEAARTAIAAIQNSEVEQPITASAGVATLPYDASDSVTLFRAADRALYVAKNAGRDCVHAASPPEPAELD